jgi:hypothetical protein
MNKETEFSASNNPQETANSKGGESKKTMRNVKIKNMALLGGLGLGGSAVALGLLGLANPFNPNAAAEGPSQTAPDIPANPLLATTVTDTMPFAEAFAAARGETGPGGYFIWHGQPFQTYYKEEWNSFTPEQKQEVTGNIMAGYNNTPHQPYQQGNVENNGITPVVVVHDVAPVAQGVTDQMAPAEAFGIARAEVGPGGVYSYHGQTFSTYLPEEVASMTENQHNEFMGSVAGGDQVQHPEIEARLEHEVTVIGYQPSFTVIGEDFIDDGQGWKLPIVLGMDENGDISYRLDTDNNGTFDTEVLVDGNGCASGYLTETGEYFPIQAVEIDEPFFDPNDPGNLPCVYAAPDYFEPEHDLENTPSDFDTDDFN